MDFYSLFPPRIEEERKRLKLSQEMAGSVCGVSREMWGKYERGKAEMGTEVLTKFSIAGADVLYIITGLRNEHIAKTTQEGSLLRAFRLLPPNVRDDFARLMISVAGPAYFEIGKDNG